MSWKLRIIICRPRLDSASIGGYKGQGPGILRDPLYLWTLAVFQAFFVICLARRAIGQSGGFFEMRT